MNSRENVDFKEQKSTMKMCQTAKKAEASPLVVKNYVKTEKWRQILLNSMRVCV